MPLTHSQCLCLCTCGVWHDLWGQNAGVLKLGLRVRVRSGLAKHISNDFCLTDLVPASSGMKQRSLLRSSSSHQSPFIMETDIIYLCEVNVVGLLTFQSNTWFRKSERPRILLDSICLDMPHNVSWWSPECFTIATMRITFVVLSDSCLNNY